LRSPHSCTPSETAPRLGEHGGDQDRPRGEFATTTTPQRLPPWTATLSGAQSFGGDWRPSGPTWDAAAGSDAPSAITYPWLRHDIRGRRRQNWPVPGGIAGIEADLGGDQDLVNTSLTSSAPRPLRPTAAVPSGTETAAGRVVFRWGLGWGDDCGMRPGRLKVVSLRQSPGIQHANQRGNVAKHRLESRSLHFSCDNGGLAGNVP
jgi:hypothetical protein